MEMVDMDYVVKISENENAVLKIIQDTDSGFNPIEDYDNLGHIICWHSRYNLGDKHNYYNPREFLEELLLGFEDDKRLDKIDEKDNETLIEELQKHVVMLPLYLYDHSGITINTTGFTCKWDS